MDLVLSIFDEPPAGARPDWTYRTFRDSWKEKGIRLVHLLPHFATVKRDGTATEQELETFMSGIFTSLVDFLGPEYDLRTRLYALYSLYTLHETQLTTTKFSINLPQEPVDYWKVLLSLRRALEKLPVTDPVRVLKAMLKGDMFHFSLVRHAEIDDDPLDMVSRTAMEYEKVEPAKLPRGLEDVRGAFQLEDLTSHRAAYQRAMDAVSSVGDNEDNVDWLALAQKTLRKHDTLRGALSRTQAMHLLPQAPRLTMPVPSSARPTNRVNDTARALANRMRRSASVDDWRQPTLLRPPPPGNDELVRHDELARINEAYTWRLQHQNGQAPEDLVPFLTPLEIDPDREKVERKKYRARSTSAHGQVAPLAATTALVISSAVLSPASRSKSMNDIAAKTNGKRSEHKEKSKTTPKAKSTTTPKKRTKKKKKRKGSDDDDSSEGSDSGGSRDTPKKKGKKQKSKKKIGGSAKKKEGKGAKRKEGGESTDVLSPLRSPVPALPADSESIEAATDLVTQLMADIEGGDDDNAYVPPRQIIAPPPKPKSKPKTSPKPKPPPKTKPTKDTKAKSKDAKPARTKSKEPKANGASKKRMRGDSTSAADEELPHGPSIEDATNEVDDLMASLENDEDDYPSDLAPAPTPTPQPTRKPKPKQTKQPKEPKNKPKEAKEPEEKKIKRRKKPKETKQPAEAKQPEEAIYPSVPSPVPLPVPLPVQPAKVPTIVPRPPAPAPARPPSPPPPPPAPVPVAAAHPVAQAKQLSSPKNPYAYQPKTAKPKQPEAKPPKANVTPAASPPVAPPTPPPVPPLVSPLVQPLTAATSSLSARPPTPPPPPVPAPVAADRPAPKATEPTEAVNPYAYLPEEAENPYAYKPKEAKQPAEAKAGTAKRKEAPSEEKEEANGTAAKRPRVAPPDDSDDDEVGPSSRDLLDSAIDDADDIINSLLGGSDSD